MSDDGSAGTAMLGLPGFRLLGVSAAYGELEQVIETTAGPAWCSGCGVAARPHGRQALWVSVWVSTPITASTVSASAWAIRAG